MKSSNRLLALKEKVVNQLQQASADDEVLCDDCNCGKLIHVCICTNIPLIMNKMLHQLLL